MAYWKHYTCVLFCAMTCVESQADTISGNVSITGRNASVQFSLVASDGVSISGIQPYFVDPPYEISICYVNTSNPCELNTPTYLIPNSYYANAFGGVAAFLQITSNLGHITPLAGIDNQVYTSPFTASGELYGMGTATNQIPCQSQLPDGPQQGECTVAVTGSGTESVTIRYEVSDYYVSSVMFNFASVPEPPTAIVLLPLSLLAAAGAYRRFVTPTKDGRVR